MEIKELKNKIRVIFPSESEIFMAEEFLSAIGEYDLTKKELEADFSEMSSMDTVFLQIALAMFKTVREAGQKITVKTSEAFDSALHAYGIGMEGITGGK